MNYYYRTTTKQAFKVPTGKLLLIYAKNDLNSTRFDLYTYVNQLISLSTVCHEQSGD